MTRGSEHITYVAESDAWYDEHGNRIYRPQVGDIVDIEASDPVYIHALGLMGLTVTIAGLVVKSRGT